MTLAQEAKLLTKEDCLSLIPKEFTFHREPFLHQMQALMWAAPQDAVALFLEMGLGKTALSIEWLRWKRITNKILIVTVNFPLADNWINEFKMTYPELKGCVLSGSRDEREFLLRQDYDFYVINYEGLKVVWDTIYSMQWNALITDESRRLKNIKAVRSMLCLELGKKIKHRAILSGLPTVHLLDIFTQFLFLNRGAVLGTNFYKFRNKYFMNKGWGRIPKWVLKKDKEEELLDLINNNCIRFLKEECLNLPEKIYQQLYIDLTPEQRADYDKLCEKEGDLSIADLTPTQLDNCFIKYSQITGGFIKQGKDDYAYYADNPKLNALLDIVEDAIDNTKITIFHRFIAEGRLIENALKERGYKYASMRSEIKDTRKEYEKFINNPKVKIMVAHPQSGGIGLNFTDSALCVYYSLDYNTEFFLQSQDRLHRIGQKKNVTYIQLLAKKTLDEEVWAAQQENISFIDRIHKYKLSLKEVIKS